jgi:hypothetical protein
MPSSGKLRRARERLRNNARRGETPTYLDLRGRHFDNYGQ